MSTRCNIRFLDGKNRVVANVYRHSDGYPTTEHGVLADLKKFFSAVEEQTKDRRFLDTEGNELAEEWYDAATEHEEGNDWPAIAGRLAASIA